MAQIEAQKEQYDLRQIPNNRASLDRPSNRADSGLNLAGDEDVNDQSQNHNRPPLYDRSTRLRALPGANFRVAKSVGLGAGNRKAGAAGEVKTECSDNAPLSAQPLSEKDAQTSDKLSSQSSSRLIENTATYRKSGFKRSRIKKGWLIKRLTGYSIAETEYGVSYLWVLSRKPDRTSADNSVWPLAGYFNWKSLEASGLLRKEKKTR